MFITIWDMPALHGFTPPPARDFSYICNDFPVIAEKQLNSFGPPVVGFFCINCSFQKKIELFLISGNHDPAGIENEVFELPQNVHYFASEKVEIKEYCKNG